MVHYLVLRIHWVYEPDIFAFEVETTTTAMYRFLACHD